MSLFITFEGIEGSGKSTQSRLLCAHLQALGHQVVVTREPGGCKIADAIRSIVLDPENRAMVPRAELLLYNAARAQHVEEVIKPALDAGRLVLCDRFFDATAVYQGTGRGLAPEGLTMINQFATGGLTPDLTLLLDFPAEIGLERARQRNDMEGLTSEGRFEAEALDFHQRIRQGYLELARSQSRFRIVDATGSPEEVAVRVRNMTDLFLKEQRKDDF